MINRSNVMSRDRSGSNCQVNPSVSNFGSQIGLRSRQMATSDENIKVTAVGPQTPMGKLMRRYWHPIAAASQFDQQPTLAIRLSEEDLVLYRDRQGAPWPNRSPVLSCVDLVCGIPEVDGLQCLYHWSGLWSHGSLP
jgi:5,5'-dehydrodivanillate O-demethylase